MLLKHTLTYLRRLFARHVSNLLYITTVILLQVSSLKAVRNTLVHFFHLLIHALQCWMHTIPLRNSYLASVHLPTSAPAQRHNPEQGTQGHWMKSAWLDANTSPFQTVSELQSAHLDFGYLSMLNYSSVTLALWNKGFEFLLISSWAFLLSWMLLLLLHCLHSKPTRWHIYVHNCSITADHYLLFVCFGYCLFINTASLHALVFLFLVLSVSTMNLAKFFSSLNFQEDVWQGMLKTSFLILASTNKALPIP